MTSLQIAVLVVSLLPVAVEEQRSPAHEELAAEASRNGGRFWNPDTAWPTGSDEGTKR